MINWFRGAVEIEDIHPLECGALRRKYRRDRRSGMPIESRLAFYPRHWTDTVLKQFRWGGCGRGCGRSLTAEARQAARTTPTWRSPPCSTTTRTWRCSTPTEAEAYVPKEKMMKERAGIAA